MFGTYFNIVIVVSNLSTFFLLNTFDVLLQSFHFDFSLDNIFLTFSSLSLFIVKFWPIYLVKGSTSLSIPFEEFKTKMIR